jgi:hypothetical protein
MFERSLFTTIYIISIETQINISGCASAKIVDVTVDCDDAPCSAMNLPEAKEVICVV